MQHKHDLPYVCDNCEKEHLSNVYFKKSIELYEEGAVVSLNLELAFCENCLEHALYLLKQEENTDA